MGLTGFRGIPGPRAQGLLPDLLEGDFSHKKSQERQSRAYRNGQRHLEEEAQESYLEAGMAQVRKHSLAFKMSDTPAVS